MAETYPIVSERTFAAPNRRFLHRTRRPIADLPKRPPGAVYVFEVDGTYELHSGTGHIHETDEIFVEATAVSVVQLRPRTLPADIVLPTASPADDITVRTWFQCVVHDPVTAARTGPISVPILLLNYLRRNSSLGTVAQGLHLPSGVNPNVDLTLVFSELSDVRRKAWAHVQAYCDSRQPALPGMSAELASLEVLTPTSWRTQGEKLRDAAFANDVANVLASHENVEIQRLAGFIAQPELAAGLGMVRDKVNVEAIVQGTFADRRTRDANILELLKLLEKNGQLDRVPIDARRLIDELTSRVAGIAPASAIAAGHESTAVSMSEIAAVAVDATVVEPEPLPDKDDRYVVE